MESTEWARSSYCHTSSCCAQWQRSSKCDVAHCVETHVDDVVSVRNSEKPELVVTFTRDEWNAFVAGVRNGEFDA